MLAEPPGFSSAGPATGEQIDVSINGEREALLDVDPHMSEVKTGLALKTPPIHVEAGPQRVTAAFLQRFEGPMNDLIAPIDHTIADTQIGAAYGITTLPHLQHAEHHRTAARDRRVVHAEPPHLRCRPTAARRRSPARGRSSRGLAAQAFRRPAGDARSSP